MICNEKNLLKEHQKAIIKYCSNQQAMNFGWYQDIPNCIISKVYGIGFLDTWYDNEDKQYYSTLYNKRKE